METKGWIKIHRIIMEDEIYFSEPFNRCMAWIDLIMLAQYKGHTFLKNGKKVELKPGELAIATASLAVRWQWSRGKVLRYLEELEEQGKIVQRKSRVINCISILNYAKYQQDSTTDSTSNSTTDSTTIHKKDNNNNNIDSNKLESCPRGGQKGDIDYKKVLVLFNDMFNGKLPIPQKMTDSRRKAIRARASEHGKASIKTVFDNVLKSPYLLGHNERNWRADFDWIFNYANFIKILEGNYLKTQLDGTGNTDQLTRCRPH